jgi:hypothetical protein
MLKAGFSAITLIETGSVVCDNRSKRDFDALLPDMGNKMWRFMGQGVPEVERNVEK